MPLPVVLLAEDDHLMQGLVVETLIEAGFELAIVATGEDVISLLTSKEVEYRALVTDINLASKLDGWGVARAAQGNERVSAVARKRPALD